MIDLLSLLKNTGAYRTIKGDKESGRLSHAYLILSPDGQMMEEYLKLFAKLMVCDSNEPCGRCRSCSLIDQKNFTDVIFYPQKDGAVLAEDVNALIEESYLRPVESNKKIFIINKAETMNASAQNKLLKTLEEPPNGVHIILGATSEFPLLSTVKSRVKKLEISAFTPSVLFDALKDDCIDHELLKSAIACSDGTVGGALSLYGDQTLKSVFDLALDVIVNMQSSKDVLAYSTKITNSKCDFSKFLSVLDLLLRDLLVIIEKKEDLVLNKSVVIELKKATRFNTGSVLHALNTIVEANKRKKFNMNATMLTEWLLFQILEGKYKWQKL